MLRLTFKYPGCALKYHKIFEKYLPSIPSINVMANNTLEEVKTLFNRLKEAKKQAELLRVEISEIKNSIYVLSESEIFKQYLGDSSDLSEGNESPNQLDPPKKKPKYDFTMDKDRVVVYTDGACENNGKPGAKAGIGVYFGDNHPLNVSRPVEGRATNNVAEIQACTEALKVARDNGISNVKVVTDSQFTINCMDNWIHKWKGNDWKLSSGGDVKNKPELQELDRMRSSMNVEFEYVEGHRGIRGNEQADRLAREGAQRYGRQGYSGQSSGGEGYGGQRYGGQRYRK